MEITMSRPLAIADARVDVAVNFWRLAATLASAACSKAEMAVASLEMKSVASPLAMNAVWYGTTSVTAA
jgi:hypothetical protein